jgi:aerobic-type carbon monoxide dehydrogenase small subunit (CoxS/CutS family)
MKIRLSLTVNNEPVETLVDDYKTLLEVLREDLNLPGTKHGCELGECGACAVLLDGEPVLSCLTLAAESSGRLVTTVEGLVEDGQLHPLQEEFADRGAAQCGYCTPGILVTAKALLDREPAPTPERIREALSGNLCRCTGYHQIVEAVEAASKQVVRNRAQGAERGFGAPRASEPGGVQGSPPIKRGGVQGSPPIKQ